MDTTICGYFEILGMGGKVNDEQRQFDVTNNIDCNREGSTDNSETEYT